MDSKRGRDRERESRCALGRRDTWARRGEGGALSRARKEDWQSDGCSRAPLPFHLSSIQSRCHVYSILVQLCFMFIHNCRVDMLTFFPFSSPSSPCLGLASTAERSGTAVRCPRLAHTPRTTLRRQQPCVRAGINERQLDPLLWMERVRQPHRRQPCRCSRLLLLLFLARPAGCRCRTAGIAMHDSTLSHCNNNTEPS